MVNSSYTIKSCDEIDFIYGASNATYKLYPQCGMGNATAKVLVVVYVNFGSGKLEQVWASLGIPFGTAMWLAIIMHFVGVEIYFTLIPKENDRLRHVVSERQNKKGISAS